MAPAMAEAAAVAANPASAELQNEGIVGGEESKRNHQMLAPFTAPKQFSEGAQPLVITQSEGIYVIDSQGKKYIDALAGLWCTALGGNETRLVEAADRQMRKLPFYHSFWNRTTEPALELARVLIDLFKAQTMGQVFFTNSGSEANDSQVKLVWYYYNALGKPLKKKFISREKAYHGSTLIAASLTGLAPMHKRFDLPVDFVRHTACPHYYKLGKPGESEEEFSTRLANELDELIEKEGSDTVAAFIAEPLLGAGGVIPPPKGYWEKIQKVLKKHEVLLIADEVVSGFGRLGQWFGCDYYGIKPDLVSIAKALSSAYLPIGAVLISNKVADVIAGQSNEMGAFSHGFTYSGHPVACAVALEAIAIYKERNLPRHVSEMDPIFQGGMRKLCLSSPIVGEVRGVGLIIGVEFVAHKEAKKSFPVEWAVGPYFGQQTAGMGMLVRTVGDVIAMSPPLVITAEEIEKILDVFGKALKKTEEYVETKRKEAA